MDMYLREAIMKYLETQEVNDTVLATSEKRKTFRRVCESISLKDGKLLCKGRSREEPKVIPTPQQVDDCLYERHLGLLGRHLTDKKTLVGALSNAGYGYPVNLGGLGALVDELVKVTKFEQDSYRVYETKGNMNICRFLRNCQTCFFSGVARPRERVIPVTVARRIELCAKFNYTCQWEEVTSTRTGETTMELESPRKKEPVGKLAEVGGEYFFSSIYYLLVGRKSGKKSIKGTKENQ